MSNLPAIQPCPFCEKSNAYLEYTEYNTLQVMCTCGAGGPILLGQQDDLDISRKTIAAWNQSSIRPKSELRKRAEELGVREMSRGEFDVLTGKPFAGDLDSDAPDND